MDSLSREAPDQVHSPERSMAESSARRQGGRQQHPVPHPEVGGQWQLDSDGAQCSWTWLCP